MALNPPNTVTSQQQPYDTATEFQTRQFQIMQALRQVQTVTLVKVEAVYGGGVAQPPTVDVLPLINQVDGAGNIIQNVTLFGRPVFRPQGGGNAFIADPVAGDIGIMVFGSRDLSSVINGQMRSPPGALQPYPPPTRRIFDYADGLYLGGLLGAAPGQYVGFLTGIVLGAPMTSTTGNLSVATGATGTFVAAGGQVVDVVAGIVVSIA